MICLANNHAKLKYMFYVGSDFRFSTNKIGEPDRSKKKKTPLGNTVIHWVKK